MVSIIQPNLSPIPNLLGNQPTPLGQIPASSLLGRQTSAGLGQIPMDMGFGNVASGRALMSGMQQGQRPNFLGTLRGTASRLGAGLADPNMLRGIASGLLTGPSRTPVSFGQSLSQGLLMGQQMQEQERRKQLEEDFTASKIRETQRSTMPKLSAEKTSRYTVVNPETGQSEVKSLQYMTINGVEDLYESVPPTPENPLGIKKVPFGNVIPFEPEPIREGMDAQAVKAYTEANNLRQTIIALDEFEGLINEGFAGGIESKIKGLTGDLKTLFGKTDLTRPEQLIKLLKAKQNTLLGKLRVAIVGPGVMTQQDAERVIESLGGDISKWTANPQILVQAIRDARATAAREFASKQSLFGALKEGKFPELLGLPKGVQDVTDAVGDF